MLNAIMLSILFIVMLKVVMLSVVILNVMAPNFQLSKVLYVRCSLTIQYPQNGLT
jgi:hypothetical protein